MVKKTIIYLSLVALFCGCGYGPYLSIPSEKTVHYPLAMAVNNNTLVVSGSNLDGKYSAGRLLALNNKKIANEISDKGVRGTLDFSKIVTSNSLSASHIASIELEDDFVAFTSMQNNKVYAQKLDKNKFTCKDPMVDFEICKATAKLDNEYVDPSSLTVIRNDENNAYMALGYLSSDKLSVLRFNKKKVSLESLKALELKKLIVKKLGKDKFKNQNIITKKIRITNLTDPNPKIYLLLERQMENFESTREALGVLLVWLNINDLLSKENISNNDFNVMDFKEFSIDGALDFVIRADKNQVFILAKNPEILFKIDLDNKALINSNSLCMDATSLTKHPEGKLLVPCFKDSIFMVYDMDSLIREHVSDQIGRGPSHMVIDKPNKLIYCSYTLEGIVGIFDLENYKYKGYVFDKAPKNREGS